MTRVTPCLDAESKAGTSRDRVILMKHDHSNCTGYETCTRKSDRGKAWWCINLCTLFVVIVLIVIVVGLILAMYFKWLDLDVVVGTTSTEMMDEECPNNDDVREDEAYDI